MAKREYSNGLQHLKFMQRAKQKEEIVKKAENEAVGPDESHWVAPVGPQTSFRKCVVIMEGDPKPGALLGRMSFGNCNATVDKLVEEAEAIHVRRVSAAKERVGATSGGNDERMRSGSVKEEAPGVADEEGVQHKKPKISTTAKLSVGGGDRRQGPWQSPAGTESKPWQGWRGEGDYRMLKPTPKR